MITYYKFYIILIACYFLMLALKAYLHSKFHCNNDKNQLSIKFEIEHPFVKLYYPEVPKLQITLQYAMILF